MPLKLPQYYDVYADELRSVGRGHALYYPHPYHGPVEIGDVGFIREGKFNRLFNAIKKTQDQNNRVPKDFEPFTMDDVETPEYIDLAPGVYDGYSAAVSEIDCNIFAQWDAAHASVSFGLGAHRRAVLKLESPTIRSQVLPAESVEPYVKKHCISWYKYAKERKFSVDFGDILLVTEWSRTSAWRSVVCTSKKSKSSFRFGPATSDFGFSQGRATHGPVLRRNHPSKRDGELSDEELSNLPNDQTIFVQGCRPGKWSLYRNSYAQHITQNIQKVEAPFRHRGGSSDYRIDESSLGTLYMDGHLDQNANATDLPSDLPDFQASVALLAHRVETTTDEDEVVVVHDSEWCDPTNEENRQIVDEFAEYFLDVVTSTTPSLAEQNSEQGYAETTSPESELQEFQLSLEDQCTVIFSEIQEQTHIEANHLERHKEKLAALFSDLLQEICRLQKDYEQQKKHGVELEDDVKSQKKNYENMVEKQRKDISALGSQVSQQKLKIFRLESEFSEERHRRLEAEAKLEIDSRESQHETPDIPTADEDQMRKEISELSFQLSDERQRLIEVESKAEKEVKDINFQLKKASRDKEESDLRWKRQLDLEKNRTATTMVEVERMFKNVIERIRPSSREAFPSLIQLMPTRPDIMVAVMGPTGTGKSSLIRLLTGNSRINVGLGGESETAEIRLAHILEPDGRRITLVEIPGFDDSRQGVSDTDILREMATFLDTEYKAGKKLNGIMYLHRITDGDVAGISLRNLQIFGKLCGPDGLKNVAIVTSRWEEVTEAESVSSEDKLNANENFKPLAEAGAKFLRHNGTFESAHRIMEYFANEEPVTLQIQIELEKGTKLEKTAAGSELALQWDQIINEKRIELEKVCQQLKEMVSDEARMRYLELVRQNMELSMEKMEAEKNRLGDDLSLERGHVLAKSEFEEWRFGVLILQQDIKTAIERLLSYEELVPRLEEVAYKRDMADFWVQRRQNKSEDKTIKVEAVLEFDRLIRTMLQMGLKRSDNVSEPIFAVMGRTGVGKSTFIKQLTGDDSVVFGNSIESRPKEISSYSYVGGGGQSVTLIDMPGFDDPYGAEGVNDDTILNMMTTFLDNKFKDGKRLSGIIYLHRIMDNVTEGAHARIMRVIRKISGSEGVKNVAVVSTGWEDIKDEAEGIMREQEFVSNTKSSTSYLDNGSKFLRHIGTFGSARRIIEILLENSAVELRA